MRLQRFKVSNFRSVKDSGWINCDDVTTLVGINEAGKSNLLLALWKLNPASGGEIDILHDLPVDQLAVLRNKQGETCFIEAEFSVTKETSDLIGNEVGCDMTGVQTITVSRYYDGQCHVDLNGVKPSSVLTEIVTEKDEEGNKTEKKVAKEYEENTLNTSILIYA